MITKKKIGVVGVDSGQLILMDPCYIDSYWEKKEFEDIRIYKHKVSGKKLQFRKVFADYETPIESEGGKTMNQLNKTGEWEILPYEDTSTSLNYNRISHAVNDNTFKSFPYPLGHLGLAVGFHSGYGDGSYDVYGFFNEDERIVGMYVDMGLDPEDAHLFEE